MTYAIWRACERFRLLPPDVRPSWDTCDPATQASLLAYDGLRCHEENQELAIMAGVPI